MKNTKWSEYFLVALFHTWVSHIQRKSGLIMVLAVFASAHLAA